jgi:hypothetical protein
MISMNMMAMTLFLELGCELMVGTADNQSAKPESKRNDMEEYLKLVMSFQKAPVSHFGFWKIVPAQPEPGSEIIKLLGRLKSRYYFRIVVICNGKFRLNEYKSWNGGLKHIADYYIISKYLENEIADVHRIVYSDYSSTITKLASFGLKDA